MAKNPKEDRKKGAPGETSGGNAASTAGNTQRMPSAEADEAVLSLARLLGRQIARERMRVPKP